MINKLTSAVATVAALLALTACDPESSTKTVPTPTNVTESIKGLCDFFVARAHETLLKPEAEGNVELWRGTPGFPADLNDYARAYYLVNATVPLSEEERSKLGEAYARVIMSCQSHGWTEK